MTPLWLTLARIGESCPQASEASFSAHERAKWERVAAYVTAGQAWGERLQGRAVLNALKNLETGEPCCGPEFKAQWFVKARTGLYRATLEPSSPEMVQFCYEKRREREGLPPLSASGTSEMRSTDRALCDAVLDESIRDATDAYFGGCAYKGRTGGKDYYEPGEAGSICQDRESRRDAASAGTDAMLNVPASPSLPPWPNERWNLLVGAGDGYVPWIKASEAYAWRDAALAEIERLKRDQAEELKAKRAIQDSLPKLYARIAALERAIASWKTEEEDWEKTERELTQKIGQLTFECDRWVKDYGIACDANDAACQKMSALERILAIVEPDHATMSIADVEFSARDAANARDKFGKVSEDLQRAMERIATLECERTKDGTP